MIFTGVFWDLPYYEPTMIITLVTTGYTPLIRYSTSFEGQMWSWRVDPPFAEIEHNVPNWAVLLYGQHLPEVRGEN